MLPRMLAPLSMLGQSRVYREALAIMSIIHQGAATLLLREDGVMGTYSWGSSSSPAW